jgi:hypothetical protein
MQKLLFNIVKSNSLNRCAKYSSIILMAIFLPIASFAQNVTDSSAVDRRLLNRIIAVESVSAAASLAGLYTLWYSDYPQSSFHFINDNKDWLQMDKIGHFNTSYYMGKLGYDLLRWPGVDKKQAIWYGGSVGFAYLTAVEVMDGFSAEWGASFGDITANALGSVAFIGQQLMWNEQRVLIKWSCHKSKYAQYRPNLLGRNFQERMLKDYNGQTYWLSINIRSFLPQSSNFPKWLNMALGYSGEGMLGGRFNPAEVNGKTLPSFDRYRQYFLSLDIDLTRIQTKSKALNMFLDAIGVIKFPCPAIEFNSQQKWNFHSLYF